MITLVEDAIVISGWGEHGQCIPPFINLWVLDADNDGHDDEDGSNLIDIENIDTLSTHQIGFNICDFID